MGYATGTQWRRNGDPTGTSHNRGKPDEKDLEETSARHLHRLGCFPLPRPLVSWSTILKNPKQLWASLKMDQENQAMLKPIQSHPKAIPKPSQGIFYWLGLQPIIPQRIPNREESLRWTPSNLRFSISSKGSLKILNDFFVMASAKSGGLFFNFQRFFEKILLKSWGFLVSTAKNSSTLVTVNQKWIWGGIRDWLGTGYPWSASLSFSFSFIFYYGPKNKWAIQAGHNGRPFRQQQQQQRRQQHHQQQQQTQQQEERPNEVDAS